jgi:hypothetical protein
MKLSIVLLLGICLAVASASNIRGDTPEDTHEAVNTARAGAAGATTQKKQQQQVTKAKHTQQQQK